MAGQRPAPRESKSRLLLAAGGVVLRPRGVLPLLRLVARRGLLPQFRVADEALTRHAIRVLRAGCLALFLRRFERFRATDRAFLFDHTVLVAPPVVAGCLLL